MAITKYTVEVKVDGDLKPTHVASAIRDALQRPHGLPDFAVCKTVKVTEVDGEQWPKTKVRNASAA